MEVGTPAKQEQVSYLYAGFAETMQSTLDIGMLMLSGQRQVPAQPLPTEGGFSSSYVLS